MLLKSSLLVETLPAKAQYGWESVLLALLLALGLVGGLVLIQVLNRWLVRHLTRSGNHTASSENPGRSSEPQEC